MAHKRTTGKKAASNASHVLRDKRTSQKSKSAAGSALSQKTGKRSHKKSATASDTPPRRSRPRK